MVRAGHELTPGTLFSDVLLTYYRQAGAAAATALLGALKDAAEDGADRDELARMAAAALAALPGRH